MCSSIIFRAVISFSVDAALCVSTIACACGEFLRDPGEDQFANMKFSTNLERIFASSYRSREVAEDRKTTESQEVTSREVASTRSEKLALLSHHLRTMLSTYLSILRHKAPANLRIIIDKYGIECIVIHGKGDPTIPVSNAESLLKTLEDEREGTDIHISDGLHSALVENPSAKQKLLEFVQES
jgi:signal transduction histidine kinase